MRLYLPRRSLKVPRSDDASDAEGILDEDDASSSESGGDVDGFAEFYQSVNEDVVDSEDEDAIDMESIVGDLGDLDSELDDRRLRRGSLTDGAADESTQAPSGLSSEVESDC